MKEGQEATRSGKPRYKSKRIKNLKEEKGHEGSRTTLNKRSQDGEKKKDDWFLTASCTLRKKKTT